MPLRRCADEPRVCQPLAKLSLDSVRINRRWVNRVVIRLRGSRTLTSSIASLENEKVSLRRKADVVRRVEYGRNGYAVRRRRYSSVHNWIIDLNRRRDRYNC